MRILKNLLRKSPLFEIVQRIHFRLRPLPRRSRHPYISQTKVFLIQEGVELETGYMGSGFGKGPVASVYIHDQEAMRLDCLGGDEGHFHVNMTQSRFRPGGERSRFYFPNGLVEDHIRQAAFQIRRNLDYARSQNHKRRIRSVILDQEKLDQAAAFMAEELLSLHRDAVERSKSIA